MDCRRLWGVALARELLELEEAHVIGHLLDPAERIAELVRERYGN